MPMLPNFVAEFSKGCYLVINADVLGAIEQYRQLGNLPEAGGILLGSYKEQHIEITHVTEPGTKDFRSRTSFYRKDPIHQKTADNIWASSDGLITYLGEWHTHPQSVPKPSKLDISEWDRNLPERPMVILIMGIESFYVSYTTKNKKNRNYKFLIELR